MGGLIVAGDRSSAGKTTTTLALLAALRQRSERVQAFKVGPDYIDPMFHRAITGRPAYNLDPVLTSERYVQQCFRRHSDTADYAIVEGVMGLFDGAGGTDWASTAHIARLLRCPVLLVVDCARLSRSLAAIVYGYQTLDPRLQFAGVVLNRVGSDRHLAMLRGAIAPLAVPVLGVLRRDDAVTLPDRHLGLVPTDEIENLPERFRHLAALGRRCFDWQALEPVFKQATDDSPSFVEKVSLATPKELPQAQAIPGSEQQIATAKRRISRFEAGNAGPLANGRPVRIGVARDRAFSFYYEDNLNLLKHYGAELVTFSPMEDESLPTDIDGLLLGGGFPELFAETLSQNQGMRRAIAETLAAGMPTYAECGGLMYLCETLVDFAGCSWPMIGAIAATTTMTGQLKLGYRQATVNQASPVVRIGQQVWGHEFHRSAIAPAAASPLYSLTTFPMLDAAPLPAGQEGWATQTLHASYLHSHWGEQRQLAQQFVETCAKNSSSSVIS